MAVNIGTDGSLETLSTLEADIPPSHLDQIRNAFPPQQSICDDPALGSCNFGDTPAVKHLLNTLKNHLIQLPDPLDARIIQTLEEICTLVGDPGLDMLNNYKTLVQRSQDDITSIKDLMTEAIRDGSKVLHWTIKAALLAYTLATAKYAKSAISSIATSADDLKMAATYACDQQKSTEKSLEHMSNTCNALTQSIARLMEDCDKKVLASSVMSKSSPTYPQLTPSVEEQDLDQRLYLIEGKSYKCIHGDLIISSTQDVVFVALDMRGTKLGKLISLGLNLVTLENILERDLDTLIDNIRFNSQLIEDYPTVSNSLKSEIIRKICERAHIKPRQWVSYVNVYSVTLVTKKNSNNP